MTVSTAHVADHPVDANVHVWDVDLSSAPHDNALSLLLPDERERAARFGDPERRHQYVTTRAVVRLLVAAYVRCMPGEVLIVIDARGKPTLARHHGLQVSISHCSARSLVAMARRAVGVDIERVDRRVDIDQAMALTLTTTERCELSSIDGEERRLAYFRRWTHKESIAKGVGAGLALGFHRFAARAGQPVSVPSPDGTRAHPGGLGLVGRRRGGGPALRRAVALADVMPAVRSRPWSWAEMPCRLALPAADRSAPSTSSYPSIHSLLGGHPHEQ